MLRDQREARGLDLAQVEKSLKIRRTNLEAIRGLEHPHQIEITIDGARVFLTTIGGETEKGEKCCRESNGSDPTNAGEPTRRRGPLGTRDRRQPDQRAGRA